MSQTVSQNHAYLIRRNGIFYFSRRVPSDLQTRFNKERVTISLRTRSQAKAEKSAEALSDRLERYWDGLRLEIFHTTELGLTKLVSSRLRDTIQSVSVKEALVNYLRLKGGIEEAETSATTYLRDWPEKYETSQMYNAYIGYCRRIGQNHPVKDTVFGKSIAKYLPSMSKRREGGNNRRHVYLLPSLDQARKDFIAVTNIPNTEWAIDCEDLFQ